VRSRFEAPDLLAGGLVVAAVTGTLAAATRRRRRAMGEVERYYTLTPEMVIFAGFDGYWKRVNPAVEAVLGYTEREALARPFMDFVHPDDRKRTEEAARRVVGGATARAFENRIVCKDGSYRWIEWTVTPVAEERVMYGVGRDVTERRRSETEQAALQRVATLVAQEVPRSEVFAAIAEEIERVLGAEEVRMLRFDSPTSAVVVGRTGCLDVLSLGSREELEGDSVTSRVLRTGQPARVDDYWAVAGSLADTARSVGVRAVVGVPVYVEGHLWGVITTGSTRESALPPDTEARLNQFTKLMATAIANAESRQTLARLAEEQAALGRVATLVAQGVPPDELFLAVTKEVAHVFSGVDPALIATVIRFDPGPESVLVGASRPYELEPIGSRWAPKDLYVSTRVLRTGGSARIDEVDLQTLGGRDAEVLRLRRFRYQVGSPVIVEGRLWGAMTLNSYEALPPDTDERLENFTELVATAIANAESRSEVERLADEQAALRRVATLVAKEDSPAEVFARVAEEAGSVLGSADCVLVRDEGGGAAAVVAAWGQAVSAAFPVGARIPMGDGGVVATILREGRADRIDDYSSAADPLAQGARARGIQSAVGCPILVRGEIWGAIVLAGVGDERYPPETEARLGQFADLVATAVANAEARSEIERLAEEQAALRRVATLVARDASSTEVFEVVATEVGKLLGTDMTVVGRYYGDGAVTAIGSWSSSPGGVPVGTRVPIGGRNLITMVAETGKQARIDDYDNTSGDAAELARRYGWRSSIAAPIVVEGRLWGVMLVATQRAEPFPTGAGQRLGAFTDLVSTAVANAQAHDEVRRFGDEQAALGRVATLVAAGADPAAVFTAVVQEVSSLLGLERIELVRYDGDAIGTVIAASGDHPFPAGSTWSLDDPSVMARVARTGRAARIDDYSNLSGEIARFARSAGFESAIGAPMTVDGRLWGVIIAISTDPEPIPDRSEARLCQFTDLVASAVANAEARHALERVAAEQATLRRIATLVAKGVQPEEVFAAVTEEVAATFRAITAVMRFEHNPPGVILVGASHEIDEIDIPIGSRWEIDEALAAAEVYRTGRPAQVDHADWSSAGGAIGDAVRRLGIVSTVACPIIVEGRPWGVITVNALEELPPDTEQRLEKFTDLVTTAIANAEAKSELAASRRRIVAAADQTRRRIERNLHDGTQQRLVSLGLAVRGAEASLPAERDDLRDQLSGVATGLVAAVEELQEISRGIHPAILSRGGLGPALQILANRSVIPVDLDITTDVRVAEPIEVAAYYVASEALANAAKHSQASRIDVSLAERDHTLLLSVRDDGVGGADTTRGSGLVGLTDRVEALGGSIHVSSRPGQGTQITAELPLELDSPGPVG
jgi:PAS domain S-box-containing protein